MSSIDDEIVRAKMRKLRVSTFADIFYEVVNDEAYADALPEDIFLAAVEEAYTQRQQFFGCRHPRQTRCRRILTGCERR